MSEVMRLHLSLRTKIFGRHIILCLPILATLFMVLESSAAQANPTQFLGAVEDMPLMQGLREVKSEALVFDKAEGRIITAIAEGGVTANDIRNFYIDTLPQLGWTRHVLNPSGSLVFEREKDRLEIAIDSTDARSTLVRFAIEPR